MREPLSFVLVGAGAIAQSYAQAFRSTSEARRPGRAAGPRAAAHARAEARGGAAGASPQERPDRVRCDAAIVCTPPSSHSAICTHFLERGIAVLCEKPLALDSTVARGMLETSQRYGALFTMASKFRYVDDVIRAKSIVTSGILGDVILFENAFTARVDMAQRWNSDPSISGGGVLIDNGTHSVDLVRYFLGPIAEVLAVEGKRVQGLAVEDTARMFVRCADGTIANVDLSWSINKELDSYIDVYGSRGSVRVGWKASCYRDASSPDWVAFGNGYDKVAAFRKQVENFSRAIRGEEPLLIDAADAIASVEVIEAAYRSLSEGRWVPVPSHGLRDAA